MELGARVWQLSHYDLRNLLLYAIFFYINISEIYFNLPDQYFRASNGLGIENEEITLKEF